MLNHFGYHEDFRFLKNGKSIRLFTAGTSTDVLNQMRVCMADVINGSSEGSVKIGNNGQSISMDARDLYMILNDPKSMPVNGSGFVFSGGESISELYQESCPTGNIFPEIGVRPFEAYLQRLYRSTASSSQPYQR